MEMPLKRAVKTTAVYCWRDGAGTEVQDQIAEEVPVALSYNGISHAVMMASPLALRDFALGFSLSERIIHSPDELYGVDIEEHEEGLELALEISSERMMNLRHQRRTLSGRTGCGLCGTESLEQAIRPLQPLAASALPAHEAVQHALQQLSLNQPLQNMTGALHGAAWCDADGQVLLAREDVGRHNALDKLIGALAARRTAREGGGFALVSSRASYEMVHKCVSTGINTLVAVSAPTSLAIKMARDANLNLIGFARRGHHSVYSPKYGEEI
ncbi:formate dehydrogenase accessory sulfurtransferase FdhD [Granulosicoccaceae sp. 1_MG-2023]|nr:formate dehydrogenase accessory sulfurtransferase FdhD [Granulosicoccaceae sp. 1_MG-2023]